MMPTMLGGRLFRVQPPLGESLRVTERLVVVEERATTPSRLELEEPRCLLCWLDCRAVSTTRGSGMLGMTSLVLWHFFVGDS